MGDCRSITVQYSLEATPVATRPIIKFQRPTCGDQAKGDLRTQPTMGENAMLSNSLLLNNHGTKHHVSSYRTPIVSKRANVRPLNFHTRLFIVDFPVTAHNLALELFRILVPQLGRLAVEG